MTLPFSGSAEPVRARVEPATRRRVHAARRPHGWGPGGGGGAGDGGARDGPQRHPRGPRGRLQPEPAGL
eukprot:8100675-Pyramimonas_sp.AAC.1